MRKVSDFKDEKWKNQQQTLQLQTKRELQKTSTLNNNFTKDMFLNLSFCDIFSMAGRQ